MTSSVAAVDASGELRDKIIIALDVETAEEAREIVNELRGQAGGFKVGLQLFTVGGPSLVREFVETGTRVFLDLKFHDIPNTVAKASIEAARLGVWMFNIHAAGGTEMMLATANAVAETCERESIEKPIIIGVTVLTSTDDMAIRAVGIESGVDGQIVRLAKLASECGLDGVVASPREVGLVRNAVKAPEFLVVTPGIRSSGATVDDQKRVTTLGRAMANGSDYVVIGRPVTRSTDRLAALEAILAGN
jgi:orotidine-5'-phosphate decarboxylase